MEGEPGSVGSYQSGLARSSFRLLLEHLAGLVGLIRVDRCRSLR